MPETGSCEFGPFEAHVRYCGVEQGCGRLTAESQREWKYDGKVCLPSVIVSAHHVEALEHVDLREKARLKCLFVKESLYLDPSRFIIVVNNSDTSANFLRIL